jgi:hypothetical protein
MKTSLSGAFAQVFQRDIGEQAKAKAHTREKSPKVYFFSHSLRAKKRKVIKSLRFEIWVIVAGELFRKAVIKEIHPSQRN